MAYRKGKNSVGGAYFHSAKLEGSSTMLCADPNMFHNYITRQTAQCYGITINDLKIPSKPQYIYDCRSQRYLIVGVSESFLISIGHINAQLACEVVIKADPKRNRKTIRRPNEWNVTIGCGFLQAMNEYVKSEQRF